jgi:hypothetical protein
MLFRLIGRALDAYDYATENDRALEAADGAIAESPETRELRIACRRESNPGTVVLCDNDWGACELDGVRLDRYELDAELEEGEVSAQAIRGVCAGRHSITTRLGAKTAHLAFLMKPGQLLLRQLDRGSASFVACDAEMEEEARAALASKELAAISYYRAVARARLNARAVVGTWELFPRVGAEIAKLVGRVDAGEDAAALSASVQKIAQGLVGAPLVDTQPLASLFGAAAWQRAAAGKLQEAWLVTNAGLVILPDEPSLLELLGKFRER